MERSAGIRWGMCGAATIAVLLALLALGYHREQFADPELLDYLAFWAAGQLALAGDPAAAWDIARHAEVMRQISDAPGIMAFPYPPPFLVALLPFALMSYPESFALWVVVTAAFYLWASRPIAPTIHAAAQPAVLINLLIGQNGFLTAGVFFAGVTRLERRPFLAGAILGLLLIKPQLALMLPVAVIAGRHWGAIAGAAVSIAGLCLIGAAVLGTGSFAAFLDMLPFYSEAMRADRFAWEEFASLFALGREIGMTHAAAMALHLLAAGLAATLCYLAWQRKWAQRVPILCAASLLASPYLQSYDTLLMLAPIGWFLTRRPPAALLLFGICLLPILTQANVAKLPNAVPIAALLALAFLCLERRAERTMEGRAALA